LCKQSIRTNKHLVNILNQDRLIAFQDFPHKKASKTKKDEHLVEVHGTLVCRDAENTPFINTDLNGSIILESLPIIFTTPGLNFINILRTAFTHVDPEYAKKTVKSAASFGAFGTYERKSCM
jgi:hypothetical protein